MPSSGRSVSNKDLAIYSLENCILPRLSKKLIFKENILPSTTILGKTQIKAKYADNNFSYINSLKYVFIFFKCHYVETHKIDIMKVIYQNIKSDMKVFYWQIQSSLSFVIPPSLLSLLLFCLLTEHSFLLSIFYCFLLHF